MFLKGVTVILQYSFGRDKVAQGKKRNNKPKIDETTTPEFAIL
jgi:hypothetical protein